VELEIEASGRGETWRLAVGAPDPSGRSVYVRRGGDPDIVVVGRHVADVADRPEASFRDRHLLPDPAALVGARLLRWQVAGGAAVSATLAGGLWHDAAGLRLARDAVEAAARALAGAEAATFASAPGVPDPAGLRLSVETSSGTIFELRVGTARSADCGPATPAPLLAAERKLAGAAGEGLCLDEATVAALARALEAAGKWDRALIAARPQEIARVTLERPGHHRMVLGRDAHGGWRLEEPSEPSSEIDEDAVTAWLDRLAEVRLDVSPVPRRTGARARATLVAERGDGTREEVRLVGPSGKRKVLIQRGDETAPAEAPASLAGELEVNAERFRARRTRDAAPEP
jgi:hypothetical protein